MMQSHLSDVVWIILSPDSETHDMRQRPEMRDVCYADLTSSYHLSSERVPPSSMSRITHLLGDNGKGDNTMSSSYTMTKRAMYGV